MTGSWRTGETGVKKECCCSTGDTARAAESRSCVVVTIADVGRGEGDDTAAATAVEVVVVAGGETALEGQ